MRVSAKIQFLVGLFVFFVIGCFVYLSVNVGFNLTNSDNKYYTVTAKFNNINGLKKEAAVKVGGIQIGYVQSIELDQDFTPKVVIKIQQKYNNIPDTSVLSIKSNSLLGDKFLSLSIGFSDPEFSTYLQDGSEIYNTIGSVDLEDLISKFALGDKNSDASKDLSQPDYSKP